MKGERGLLPTRHPRFPRGTREVTVEGRVTLANVEYVETRYGRVPVADDGSFRYQQPIGSESAISVRIPEEYGDGRIVGYHDEIYVCWEPATRTSGRRQ